MIKKKSVYDYIFVASMATLLFILGALICGYPQEFYIMSGRHNWLTGSTIKFLNNWLETRPWKTSFLMLENPNSIEFTDLASRVPYVSYPSGVLFIPYIISKSLQMDYVGFTFMNIISTCFFLADTVTISLIFLMIGRHCTFIKHSGILMYGSIFLGLLWSLLPASQYYLKHVFFSDQSVLLFIYLMVFMEFYLWTHETLYTNTRRKVPFFIARLAVIFIGMWTDYFFWIFIFIAFLIRFFSYLKKLPFSTLLIRSGKEYILPVFLSVAAFALQINSVPNGWDMLLDVFLIRTSSIHNGQSIRFNVFNFIRANLTAPGAVLFLIGLMIFILCLFSFLLKRKRTTEVPKQTEMLYRIGSLILFPPILQIILLGNHSGVHEFSIIKLGFPFVFSVFFLALVLLKKIEQIPLGTFRTYATVSILLIPFLCTYIIFVGGRYYHERISEGSETEFRGDELAETIRNHFYSYYFVLFSCSEEIQQNPPTLLARTGKRIYLIDAIEDIASQFPQLDEEAQKIFILYKEDMENTENETLWEQLETFIPIIETENYAFYRIP